MNPVPSYRAGRFRRLASAVIRRAKSVFPERLVPRPVPSPPLFAVRCGIVGAGVMGRTHAQAMLTSRHVSLAGLCSRHPSARSVAEQFDCTWYDSPEALFSSGAVDAVVIATPHRQHANLAISALREGLHVLCEKPLCVTASEADEVLEAAANSSSLLTVVSQNRFEPSYRAASSLLASGELGAIRRCNVIETFWRPDSYYRSANWRGTWAGEGGGVLMNQAPHVIDRYVWLCGRPDAVVSMCETVLHQVEVEDTASLLLRHDNGIQGFIHVSTNEQPPISRLEIACDRGRITVDNGDLTVERLSGSITTETSTLNPESGGLTCTVERRGGNLLNWSPELLHGTYQDFAESIRTGRQPEVTAEQARDVVQIINAGHLSSWKKTRIDLPVDSTAYDDFQQAMAASTRLV